MPLFVTLYIPGFVQKVSNLNVDKTVIPKNTATLQVDLPEFKNGAMTFGSPEISGVPKKLEYPAEIRPPASGNCRLNKSSFSYSTMSLFITLYI